MSTCHDHEQPSECRVANVPEPRQFEPMAAAAPTATPPSVDRLIENTVGYGSAPSARAAHLPGLEVLKPLRWTWGDTLELEAEIGNGREVTVQIWNDDDVARELHTVAVTGSTAFRVERVSVASIPPGAAADIVVRFEPNGVYQRGTLVVAPDRGPGASMSLIGRGVPRAPAPAPQAPSTPARLEPPRSQHGMRLSPPPDVVDFGEQVHGSYETRRIGAPFNLTQQPAVATFSVKGSSFRLLSARTLTLSPSGQMNMANWERNSPLIEYAPVGTKNVGTLTTTVVWGDGTTEVQHVRLVGRARFKDEAPSREPSAQEIAEEGAARERLQKERAAEQKRIADDQTKTESYPQNAANALGVAYKNARDAAIALARAQQRAVQTVDAEAACYDREVAAPSPSIWLGLLEVGLTMATSGIAAQVAKGLLPSLLSRLGGGDGNKKLSEFTTEIVKEGLKTAGKTAVKGAMSGSRDGKRAPSAVGPVQDDASYNFRIEFFRQQSAAHDRQATNNEELIDERFYALQPLLRTKPIVAASVMTTLADELAQQKQFAEAEQARTTRLLWTTSVVRRELGKESAKMADGKDAGVVTKLDDARTPRGRKVTSARDGLLDIVLARSHAFPTVVSARMTGVAAEIALRIIESPLLDFPMPVRFVLGASDAEPTIVTRDEAGRVRVHGDLLYFLKYSSSSLDVRAAREGEQIGPRRRDAFEVAEAEAIAGATHVVERILSRPLTSWGLRTIEHDDATGVEGRCVHER